MKILFFDSGIGGLTIFNECKKRIKAEYIYVADNLNTPYGTKEKSEVLNLVISCIKKIKKYNSDIIVIACNTATSVAINELREIYKNKCIIGLEPAVKVARDNLKSNKKILVCATSLTSKEEKLQNLINELGVKEITEFIPLDKLVIFAEQLDFDSNNVKKYLYDKFKNIDKNEYEYLVLGCTHFPLFKDVLNNFFKNTDIKIIDSCKGVVNNIINHSKELNLKQSKESKYTLVLTKNEDDFISKFKKITQINTFVTEIL